MRLTDRQWIRWYMRARDQFESDPKSRAIVRAKAWWARRVAHLVNDSRALHALAVAEAYASNRCTWDELDHAAWDAMAAELDYRQMPADRYSPAEACAITACGAAAAPYTLVPTVARFAMTAETAPRRLTP
jgi:hypothetical protein